MLLQVARPGRNDTRYENAQEDQEKVCVELTLWRILTENTDMMTKCWHDWKYDYTRTELNRNDCPWDVHWTIRKTRTESRKRSRNDDLFCPWPQIFVKCKTTTPQSEWVPGTRNWTQKSTPDIPSRPQNKNEEIGWHIDFIHTTACTTTRRYQTRATICYEMICCAMLCCALLCSSLLCSSMLCHALWAYW